MHFIKSMLAASAVVGTAIAGGSDFWATCNDVHLDKISREEDAMVMERDSNSTAPVVAMERERKPTWELRASCATEGLSHITSTLNLDLCIAATDFGTLVAQDRGMMSENSVNCTIRPGTSSLRCDCYDYNTDTWPHATINLNSFIGAHGGILYCGPHFGRSVEHAFV
ncbi:hypothetical protein F5Y15DRAFT_375657 [Xylariaceae sp. FL0016]|nr:hypothetical protein F5Y15DRAFT_375657 [Xylariaceae sp. FL0016]